MTDRPQSMFGKVGEGLYKLIAMFSALNLFLMMVLTAIAVISRYFFNKPVPGDTELMECMMAIFVPLSVAICAAKRQHIAVDLFVERMPRRAQACFGAFSALLVTFFFGLIAWQSYSYILDEAQSQTTTAVLLIPTYPFIAPLILMGAVIVVVTLYQLFHEQIKGIFGK